MSAAISIDNLYSSAWEAHSRGELTQAVGLYQQILKIRPRHIPTLKAYGVLAFTAGATERGLEMLALAAKGAPDDAEAWANYGNALREVQRPTESAEACQKAVELNPRNAHAQSNLAAALRATGRPGLSVQHAYEAVKLLPNLVEAHVNLASGLQSSGNSGAALGVLANCAVTNPTHLALRQNLLFTSLYSDELTDEQISQMHADFGQMFEVAPVPAMRSKCQRIGFVSGDFRRHPVGRFFSQVLGELRNQGFEAFLYANQHENDEVSQLLAKECDQWSDVISLSDEDLAKKIRIDEVDLLIDLSGHSALNRLPMFCLRPCAVQATWLGYSSTTGMPAMDYLIGDEYTNPEQHDHLATERIARLTGPFLCDLAPKVIESPIPHDGFVFASFNNTSKMSNRCIALWSRILKGAPDSRMVLKYSTFQDELVCDAIAERFESEGIARDRLDFVGFQSRAKHEAFFRTVDLCLDTAPYTGATTTIDAIKGGAPVLTLSGARYSARMSTSVLKNLGLDQLVCETAETFVDQAIGYATNPGSLRAIRESIPALISESKLFDPGAFAKSFGRLAHEMHRGAQCR